MEENENLSLLFAFYGCSHLIHRAQKYPGQGRLLILLLQGPMTQRELIERTGRRSATLSEQLDSMEKAGYITRKKNAADRRNLDIELTAPGRETALDAAAARAELADRLFAPLSTAEKAQLTALLRRVALGWEPLPGGEG